MRLRKLNIKDTDNILEWMKDESINQYFRFNASSVNKESVKQFILSSLEDKHNYHFAIVNEDDEYLGTISLKNVDLINKNAEYAISLRKCAIGKGVAEFGTKQVFSFAFNELGLNRIYLNVYSDNIRAIKFYKKIGFAYEGEFKNHLFINNEYKSLKWYGILKETYMSKTKARFVEFKENGDDRGHLVVVEEMKDIPFDIKRVFYIYGSDKDVIRGCHANRKSEFVLINVSGTSKVKTYDGQNEEIFELDKPHTGVYIPKMLWKDMYDFSEDSILLVLCSDLYDPTEYIRDKDAYKKEMELSNEFVALNK